MSEIPEELKYTKSHEWLRIENDLVTVGITQHAQEQLGDIVFVELPEEGDNLSTGDECGVIESVKTASDVYAPVNGEVVAINAELEDSPGTVNQSPYGDGWLFQLKNGDAKDISELLSAEEYAEMIAEEA